MACFVEDGRKTTNQDWLASSGTETSVRCPWRSNDERAGQASELRAQHQEYDHQREAVGQH
tara:strand:- start:46 stop:228 length:183 start_codon:yes stop_codon:yes gene_type:complete